MVTLSDSPPEGDLAREQVLHDGRRHVLAERRPQLVALLEPVDHRVEAVREVLELVARVHALDVHVVELLDALERRVHACAARPT